jgi:hypothetical protein
MVAIATQQSQLSFFLHAQIVAGHFGGYGEPQHAKERRGDIA